MSELGRPLKKQVTLTQCLDGKPRPREKATRSSRPWPPGGRTGGTGLGARTAGSVLSSCFSG